MSQDRIARLDTIGFVWDIQESKWEERFAELEVFKARYHHWNVSQKWPENQTLGTWVSNLRAARRKGRGELSDEQIVRLDSLGFVWDFYGAEWEEKVAALEEFKAINHHCDVPQASPENRALAAWLNIQRINRRQNELSDDRVGRLEALGVVWDVLVAQ